MSICGICKERRPLGTCSFGGGKVPVSPHCRGCCTDAEGDKWRPLRARRPARKAAAPTRSRA